MLAILRGRDTSGGGLLVGVFGGQERTESSSDTTSILGQADRDILADSWSKDLLQPIHNVRVEARIVLEQGSINSNSSLLLPGTSMLKDSSNGGGRETGGTLADQLDDQLDDLAVVHGCAGEVEGRLEDLAGRVEGGGSVGFDGRHVGGLEGPHLVEIGRDVALEEKAAIDQVEEDVTGDLSEVHAGNHLFEDLLVGVLHYSRWRLGKQGNDVRRNYLIWEIGCHTDHTSQTISSVPGPGKKRGYLRLTFCPSCCQTWSGGGWHAPCQRHQTPC